MGDRIRQQFAKLVRRTVVAVEHLTFQEARCSYVPVDANASAMQGIAI